MPVAEKIDIDESLRAICDQLGVEYNHVYKIEVEPSLAAVTVFSYEVTDEGRFYIRHDGEVATVEQTFPIRT